MRVEDAKAMEFMETNAIKQAEIKKSTPGAIAGKAAAQTATIDQNAVRRETQGSSQGAAQSPGAWSPSGGQNNSTPIAHTTPLVIPAPAKPDYRSMMDPF